MLQLEMPQAKCCLAWKRPGNDNFHSFPNIGIKVFMKSDLIIFLRKAKFLLVSNF